MCVIYRPYFWHLTKEKLEFLTHMNVFRTVCCSTLFNSEQNEIVRLFFPFIHFTSQSALLGPQGSIQQTSHLSVSNFTFVRWQSKMDLLPFMAEFHLQTSNALSGMQRMCWHLLERAAERCVKWAWLARHTEGKPTMLRCQRCKLWSIFGCSQNSPVTSPQSPVTPPIQSLYRWGIMV